MRTRADYLKNPDSFSELEEKELIDVCLEQMKEHPHFYMDWNLEMGENFVHYNMLCISQYEKRKGIKLEW